MLRSQISVALLIASAYPFITEVRAENLWQGSYAADGQCFCSGEIPQSLATRIVPTPVGGQTIKQVCKTVGQGPGLTLNSGVFNYPVFKDPQCGNGPFNSANGPRDLECVGTTDGTYGSCQSAGPRWALAQAYASPSQDAQTNSELANSSPDVIKGETTIADGSTNSEQDLPDVAALAKEPVKKTEKPAQLASGESEKVEPELAEFAGKSVVLGNDRYLQAREGLAAKGGARGSRIILDGQLYIRQDERLDVADLYQEQAVPVMAAAKPEEPEETTLAKQSAPDPVKTDDQKEIVAARLEQEKLQRKEEARQQFIAEQKARRIRLAEEKNQQQAEKLEQANSLKQKYADKAKQAYNEKQKKADEMKQANSQSQKQADEIKQANSQKQKQAEEKKLAERQKKAEEEKQLNARRDADKRALAEASTQTNSPGNETESAAKTPTVLSGLRLPTGARASSRDFAYFEAMPASYDIGGNGVIVEASAQSNARFQYLARVGISDSYNEVMVGGGYYVTPQWATRMTVILLAGVEFGSFELRDDARAPGLTVNTSDNGLYMGAMSRFVINNKFELKAGVGYSTFFEGDATVFGGGYYHITSRLDFMSRFELGDNDQLGIGIRYYY